MEAVKYLCDFFFGPGSFWHFFALCVLCMCLSSKGSNNIIINPKKEKEEEE